MRCSRCHSDNTDAARSCSNGAIPLGPEEHVLVSLTKTIETPLKVLTRGSIIAGKYKILEEIDRGGIGAVCS